MRNGSLGTPKAASAGKHAPSAGTAAKLLAAALKDSSAVCEQRAAARACNGHCTPVLLRPGQWQEVRW